jgi:hypothetical protein
MRARQSRNRRRGARKGAPGTSIPAEPPPWITAKIQAKYFVDDDVKARNIDVTTQSRVLTLQGTVSSEAERRQAIAMARNNSGVREICGSAPTRLSTMARCTVREPLVGGVAVIHPASSCLAKKYRVAGMVRTRRERVLSSLPEELMGKLVWVLAPFAAVAWFVLLAFNSSQSLRRG